MGDTWGPGIALIMIFLVLMAVPCTGAALLGYKMINKLSYFPSKTPAIQKSILVKLIIIEIISLTLLMLFYHAMTDYEDQALLFIQHAFFA